MSLTAGASVYTGDRRKHRLGPLLKSGGAGSVYPLLDSADVVAKIYHDSIDHAESERKVTAMLYLSPNLPDLVDAGRRYVQIAWPQSLLRDGHGQFVGFLMPSIDVQSTSELECILQERQAKAAGLPSGLGAKVTLAANLSAVIAELHRQGHHVIDLKPVNLRFYRQSLYMAMLDCDGFSIEGSGERFLAQQITPDYLAPEFQSQAITSAGEEQQDRFALAVVIFQLLNFGIHPFTGRPANEHVPTDIPGRIAQRCYAYGLHPNANMEPSPVSGHLSMPSDLRSLFDRAFEGQAVNRPSASEWAATLKQYAQRSNAMLVLCGRDRQHQHFAGQPCAACARGALIANTARVAEAAKSAEATRKAEARKRSMTRPLKAVPSGQLPLPRLKPAGTQPAQSSTLIPGLPSSVQLPAALVAMLSRPAQPVQRVGKLGAQVMAWIAVCICLIFIGVLTRPMARNVAQASEPQAVGADATPTQQMRHVIPAAIPVPDAIRMLISAVLSEDPPAEAQAFSTLRRVAGSGIQARKDYQTQFERGELALENNDRVNAKDWFTQAIGDDPNRPESWYGLAIAADNDNDAIGALAIAEMLHPGSTSGTALPLAGADPGRFRLLRARGQRVAARLEGEPAPADAEALAKQVLPPR